MAEDASLRAAAMKMEAGPSNGKLYTEEDWNTESKADKEGGYMYSKVWLWHGVRPFCFAVQPKLVNVSAHVPCN